LGVALAALVLLVFFLPPSISLPRFRARIARSMEQALGRKVAIGEVTLRVLPRPGFDLHRLSIADDPAFGAEPMLLADDVTMALRLAPLWRGRLEVAALSLKSGVDINPPSLNLVRNAEGRWNIEALLQRASQTPTAPTGQAKAEARPRFPYIEISGGRINFKSGQEKKVYVLTEADFALWLAAEDQWRFRLAARPVRTDFNLSDTGVVRANGWFRRAAHLRDTPMDLSVALQEAQLGALTKLAYGRDRGWRGAVSGSAHLMGTPAELQVSAEAQVRDFRRYDIKVADSLRLQAQCNALYGIPEDRISDLDCQLPLGKGRLLARGSVDGFATQSQNYHLNLTAESVGLQTLVLLARHIKKDLPADLSARGELEAAFELQKSSPGLPAVWSGGGHTSGAALGSSLLTPELPLAPVTFAWEGPGAEKERPAVKHSRQKRRRRPAPALTAAPELRLVLAPLRVPMGASAPLEVRGWFSHLGYQIDLQGEARVPRLLQAAQALGLPASSPPASGSATGRLQLAGVWAGFGPPHITGEVQVRDLSAAAPGLNGPLELASAELELGNEETLVRRLLLRFPGFGLQLSGTARLSRGCAAPEPCRLQFDLQADEVALDDLNRLVNPALAKRPWYDVFSSPSGSILGRLQASGHLEVGRVLLKALPVQHFSADLELAAGELRLTAVQGELLGGQYRGDWRADFRGPQPKYEGTGSLRGIAMPQLATLMHDNWAGGALDISGRVTFSGSTASRLAASLAAAGEFEWRNGLLRHVILDSRSAPLEFKQFAGQFELQRGTLAFSHSRMAAVSGQYLVGGTVSLGRELALTLRDGKHLYDLSGTLAAPKVTPSAQTQAALQP